MPCTIAAGRQTTQGRAARLHFRIIKDFPFSFSFLAHHTKDVFSALHRVSRTYVLFPCKGRERREYTKDRKHYFWKIFMRQPSTDCTQSGCSAKFHPKFLGLHPLYPLSLITSKKKDYTTNVIPMKEKTFLDMGNSNERKSRKKRRLPIYETR